jgi:hypothetical protein
MSGFLEKDAAGKASILFDTNAAVGDLFRRFTRPICRGHGLERALKCDLKAIDPA